MYKDILLEELFEEILLEMLEQELLLQGRNDNTAIAAAIPGLEEDGFLKLYIVLYIVFILEEVSMSQLQLTQFHREVECCSCIYCYWQQQVCCNLVGPGHFKKSFGSLW